MEKEYLLKQIIRITTEIIHKLISEDFRISQGEATKRIFSNALDRLEGKYGELSRQRIVDYVVTSLFPFKKRGTDWKLNQAFGPKSLERYNTDKGLRYYEDRWLSSANISRSSLVDVIEDKKEHPKAKFLYMASEERTKQRLLNQEIGFLICQTTTLGWSPLSDSCNMCVFVDKCKQETNKKYPEIYRLREEYGKQK